MRRNLAAVAVVCSLLWVVSGVSVLALALHEHGHHGEAHDHHDAIQAVLHGHAHESLPDHDHEFTAPLSASKTISSGHSHAIASQAYDLAECVVSSPGAVATCLSTPRKHGPPSYLMNCVLLT